MPTATASGGIAYANGPIVVGPQGAVWGVSSGNQIDGAQEGGVVGGTNQGVSGGGPGFLGIMGVGGQGLGKEGLGGSPAGLVQDAGNGAAGQQEQLGMLRPRLQGQPEMLLTERQGQ